MANMLTSKKKPTLKKENGLLSRAVNARVCTPIASSTTEAVQNYVQARQLAEDAERVGLGRSTAKVRQVKCLSPEERHQMIAVAAYFLAEKSAFQSDPVANWLEAEAQIAEQWESCN